VPRLRRFLHIERSRAEAASPADAPGDAAGRIGNVEASRPAPAPAGSGAELGRFGPAPVALQDPSPGERPFTRCAACGMDHSLLARECAGCGAPLDTDAQRAFNEALWARRREEAAREEAAAAERRAARAEADAELARARRAMGEALAREVGDRERRRLEEAGLGRPGLSWAGAGRLLRRLVRRGR
jgi:hypothetical protein